MVFPGISFCDNLAQILKYIDNPETPDYVVQKYIGMPLLPLFRLIFGTLKW